MRDWRRVSLNTIAEIYDGPHATPTKLGHGPWYLNIASLQSGRLRLEESVHISEDSFALWTRRVRPCPGDVLFSYETRLGEAAAMPDHITACLGRRMGLLRPRRSEVEPRFLLYAYLGPLFQETIRQRTVHGATVERLPISEMGTWEIEVPPLSEQHAIVEVLGALDDKIDANARVVDAIDGLVRVEVAAALTDTQREASLGDLLQRVNEIAKPHELDQMSLYVGLEHMPRGSLFLKSWGSGEALASAKARFRPGDILFGRLRPYFKKVAVAPSLGVCSTDVLVLRPKVEGQAAFATVVCASDEVVDYASRGSEGTRMPRVSWDYLSRFRVPLPADADLLGLDRRIAPPLHLGTHLPLESIALARLRDALLPKLVSGELGVRDAESLVEAVV